MVSPFSGHRSRRRRARRRRKLSFCLSSSAALRVFWLVYLVILLHIRAEIPFLLMMIFLGTGLKIFPMADFHHDLQKFSFSEVAG